MLLYCLFDPAKCFGDLGKAGDNVPPASQPLVDGERQMILEGIFDWIEFKFWLFFCCAPNSWQYGIYVNFAIDFT